MPRARPTLSICPGIGVGPVQFGMTKAETRRALAELGLESYLRHGTLEYFGKDSALLVKYARGTVSSIALLACDTFDCTIAGVNPFDTATPQLFELLRDQWGTADQVYKPNRPHVFRRGIVALYPAGIFDAWGGHASVVLLVGDARHLASIDAFHRRCH